MREWAVSARENIFWLLLTLLGLFYVAIILFKAENIFFGDEHGYFQIAKELAVGTLPSVNWWGPGYPIILIPFARYQVPLLYAKLLNAAFLIGSIVYLRYSLLLYISEKYSTRIALIMGGGIFLFYLIFT